jgi:hypothetical protein
MSFIHAVKLIDSGILSLTYMGMVFQILLHVSLTVWSGTYVCVNKRMIKVETS